MAIKPFHFLAAALVAAILLVWNGAPIVPVAFGIALVGLLRRYSGSRA